MILILEYAPLKTWPTSMSTPRIGPRPTTNTWCGVASKVEIVYMHVGFMFCFSFDLELSTKMTKRVSKISESHEVAFDEMSTWSSSAARNKNQICNCTS